MSAVVVVYFAVEEGNDVAAHGHVLRLHLVAYGSGLQRAAALVYFIEVVAQDGGVGHLAARMESLGDGVQAAGLAVLGQQVHIGCVGKL